MNINKKKLYLEISPITYKGNQFTVIISGMKGIILCGVRVTILVIILCLLLFYPYSSNDFLTYLVLLNVLGLYYLFLGRDVAGIRFDYCVMKNDTKQDKEFKSSIYLWLPEWKEIKNGDYQSLMIKIFREYNIYETEELENTNRKNWDGIIK